MDEERCPICRRPIRPGAAAALHRGRLVHALCLPSPAERPGQWEEARKPPGWYYVT